MFSNRVSLDGITEAFESSADAAKEVAEEGKGKQRAVNDKKDQSDDDVVEIIE